MTRLWVALCLLAAPLSAQQADPLTGFEAAFMQACLSDAAAPEACIGTYAQSCMSFQGQRDPQSAMPCFGAEAAYWEARIAIAMTRLEAQEPAARVDGPAPRPSLASMVAAFEAHRQATCDFAGALHGETPGAGPAAVECRMRLAGEQALRLERWIGRL